MPTYVYAVVKPDGSLGEHFEVVQKMSDVALERHPESGEPVRRVPQAPMRLSRRNIFLRDGFTC